MKTFLGTQTINMINTRYEERKLPGAVPLVTSHIAQHWFSGCSREAQKFKALGELTTMLLLLSKLLIRKSSGDTQPNSTPLGNETIHPTRWTN